jgi:hypothetical protein
LLRRSISLIAADHLTRGNPEARVNLVCNNGFSNSGRLQKGMAEAEPQTNHATEC